MEHLINLNFAPGGLPATVHVSQYDDTIRQLRFQLWFGRSKVEVPSGASVRVDIKKPDGHIVLVNGTVNSSDRSIVTVPTTKQMTAVPGGSRGTLVVSSTGDKRISSAIFILQVHRDPVEDGDASDSDLSMLQDAIDQTAANASAAAASAAEAQEAAESFTTDTTLSVTGKAADAKKTGDEISAIKADLDAQTSELKQALLPFVEHLIGTFDDENGGEYTEALLAVLRAGTPEPIVNMVKSENLIGTTAQLFTDEGTTEQASLKTSGSRYYYLDTPADEDCTYKVTITITTDLNSFRYGTVYAYNGEILTGKGTATPTAYNLTNTKEGGIISVADPNPDLTGDYVFETQISGKANRNLAIMFYRDYDSCIGSVTAQKVG